MINAVVALNIEISEEKHRPHLPCQRYYPQFVRLCVVTSIRNNDQRNSQIGYSKMLLVKFRLQNLRNRILNFLQLNNELNLLSNFVAAKHGCRNKG